MIRQKTRCEPQMQSERITLLQSDGATHGNTTLFPMRGTIPSPPNKTILVITALPSIRADKGNIWPDCSEEDSVDEGN